MTTVQAVTRDHVSLFVSRGTGVGSTAVRSYETEARVFQILEISREKLCSVARVNKD